MKRESKLKRFSKTNTQIIYLLNREKNKKTHTNADILMKFTTCPISTQLNFQVKFVKFINEQIKKCK